MKKGTLLIGLIGAGALVAVMGSKKKAHAALAPASELLLPSVAPSVAVVDPIRATGELEPHTPPQVVVVDDDDDEPLIRVTPTVPADVVFPSPVGPPPGPPADYGTDPVIMPPMVVTPEQPTTPKFVPPEVVAPAPVIEVVVPPEVIIPASVPTVLADDTAALLAVMLGRENTTDWKRKEPLLGVWQKSRGLVADKKFGPGSAAKLAEETGLLPIVRFWPRGAIREAGAVEDYQGVLLAMAASAEEPRAAQLVAAANRESGQGFGRHPDTISPVISI